LWDVWDLLEDQSVFRDISEGSTETVFQLNTNSAKQWLKLFDYWKNEQEQRKAIDSIDAISAFTALDRPGPLDAEVKNAQGKSHNMLVEYANRVKGKEKSGNIPMLDEMFPETYGVITYQEQIEKLYKEITGCDGGEAVKFRKNIAKKQMDKVKKAYPLFMERASIKVGAEQAQAVWDQIVTFAQYGFNKSVDQNTILVVNGKEKPIRDCIAGDTIESVDENGELITTDIKALHYHGELEAFEIELDDGFKITCSINHKFLTVTGMKPLHEILYENLEILAFKA
jgi:hypothetical protein